MTIEEFIEARLLGQLPDRDTITEALFHAEMDRRGLGPGCASFGTVWSQSEEKATGVLLEPHGVWAWLDVRDRRPVAAIWCDHPDYRPEWAVEGGGTTP